MPGDAMHGNSSDTLDTAERAWLAHQTELNFPESSGADNMFYAWALHRQCRLFHDTLLIYAPTCDQLPVLTVGGAFSLLELAATLGSDKAVERLYESAADDALRTRALAILDQQVLSGNPAAMLAVAHQGIFDDTTEGRRSSLAYEYAAWATGRRGEESFRTTEFALSTQECAAIIRAGKILAARIEAATPGTIVRAAERCD